MKSKIDMDKDRKNKILESSLHEKMEPLVSRGFAVWNGGKLTTVTPIAKIKGDKTIAQLLLENRPTLIRCFLDGASLQYIQEVQICSDPLSRSCYEKNFSHHYFAPDRRLHSLATLT